MIVVSLVGLVVGGGMAVMGAIGLVNEKRLDAHGAIVQARVTEARVQRVKASDSFQLRFAFELPGRMDTFTAEDETGRSNLWASVDGRADWEAALNNGRIAVVYLPENPRVNRLVQRHGVPVADVTAALLIGLLIGGSSLLLGWLEATGQGQRWRAVVVRIRAAFGTKSAS